MKGYDEKKHGRDAVQAQDASNVSGVMAAAIEMLKEWRAAGGDWNGRGCVAFRLMLHKVVDLSRVRYDDYTEDYQKCRKEAELRNDELRN